MRRRSGWQSGCAAVALAAGGDAARARSPADDHGAVDGRRLHRRVGQRGQRRRRRRTRSVKSIVTGAAADPHSFEATPADVAEISDASLVVYNGGGYDHWVDDVLAGHPGRRRRRRLLTAARHRSSPPTNTSSTTSAPPRPSPSRSPSDSPRSTPRTPTTTAPTPPNSASRPTTIAASERAIGKAHPAAVGRRDRAGRLLPAAQRRNHRQAPRRASPARSRRATTRHLPTWPPCST